MSDADFRAVIDALSAAGPVRPEATEPIHRVAVLGAGAIGQLLACEALAAGHDVRLNSVSGHELDDLRAAGGVSVRGAHLVGNYAVGASSEARPSIELTASVDETVSGAEVVFVATPAVAHTTYAALLAGSLTDGQVVVLVPGRFLGSVAFQQALAQHHCPANVTVAELSAAPYVASRDGARITVHGVTQRIDLATLPTRRSAEVADRLAGLLPMLRPVDSPLDTAFAGVTGVVAVAPLLTNTALVDSKGGAAILLKELVPASLSQTLLRQLDEERLAVAFHYGVRDLPTAATWLRDAYGGGADDSAADDVATALEEIEMFDAVTVGGTGGPSVVDDVPHSLVPLSLAGLNAGVPTPATNTVVALASCLVGADLTAAGRSLAVLGLGDVRPAEVRSRLREVADSRPAATTWWRV